MESTVTRIGDVPQTPNQWVKRLKVDMGAREGVITAEGQRVDELEREVKKLRRANEILRLVSVFCPAGNQPPTEVLKDFMTWHRDTR